MSRFNLFGSTVLVATVAVASLSLSACCKEDKKEEPAPKPVVSATAAPATTSAAAAAEPTNPDWKTKCPAADRPMSGTVTTLRVLEIREKPDGTSKKLSTISPGTWVNLLGAKGNWYCIDYPCAEGKLCPGWIMSRYSKRRPPKIQDAGTTKKDAAAEKAEKKDAQAAQKDAAAKKDAQAAQKDAAAPKSSGKKPGLRLIPRLKFKLPKKK